MKARSNFTRIAAIVASAAAVSLFGLAPSVATAAETHAHSDAANAHQLTLDHGRKWQTDEALRTSMIEIRAALGDLQSKQKSLTGQDFQAAGNRIDSAIGYIVANCKLEPEADRNLHLVLEHMVKGSDGLKANDPQQQSAGMTEVADALQLYGEYFDHPAWARQDRADY